MPTLVNNLRAIRGPVTSVPVTAGSGIEIDADTKFTFALRFFFLGWIRQYCTIFNVQCSIFNISKG